MNLVSTSLPFAQISISPSAVLRKYKLVATGNKISETIDGKELITNWKNDKPLTVAGFAFGDYKLVSDKVGDIEIHVYANNQPDDLSQVYSVPFRQFTQ